MVAARVTDRVGKGLRSPARDAMIAQVTAPEARGRAFGFHRAADHLGAVAGSLAAWLLLSRGLEVRGVILWSVVPGVFAMLVLWRVLADRRIGGSAERGIVYRPRRIRPSESAADPPIRRSAEFWIPIGAMTLLLVSRIPETLLLLRLQDLGVAVSAGAARVGGAARRAQPRGLSRRVAE